MPSSLLKVANNLFQTCYNKLRTSSANTTCWQLIRTDLLQLVCRLVTTCAFLRMLLVHKLLICFAHLFRNPDVALREKSTSADLCRVKTLIASSWCWIKNVQRDFAIELQVDECNMYVISFSIATFLFQALSH